MFPILYPQTVWTNIGKWDKHTCRGQEHDTSCIVDGQWSCIWSVISKFNWGDVSDVDQISFESRGMSATACVVVRLLHGKDTCNVHCDYFARTISAAIPFCVLICHSDCQVLGQYLGNYTQEVCVTKQNNVKINFERSPPTQSHANPISYISNVPWEISFP